MPNKFVIFPTSKLASATAYKLWADEQWIVLSGEPNGVFDEVHLDAFGQHVVAYYGPPFTLDGINDVEEPAGGPAMRADGVLHESVVWPELTSPDA